MIEQLDGERGEKRASRRSCMNNDLKRERDNGAKQMIHDSCGEFKFSGALRV